MKLPRIFLSGSRVTGAVITIIILSLEYGSGFGFTDGFGNGNGRVYWKAWIWTWTWTVQKKKSCIGSVGFCFQRRWFGVPVYMYGNVSSHLES